MAGVDRLQPGDGVVAAGGGAEDGGSEGHELVHVQINYITTCTILWVDPSLAPSVSYVIY